LLVLLLVCQVLLMRGYKVLRDVGDGVLRSWGCDESITTISVCSQLSPRYCARRYGPATPTRRIAGHGPLTVVLVPPLVDYPNHLAKAYLAISLPENTQLANFYEWRLRFVPSTQRTY